MSRGMRTAVVMCTHNGAPHVENQLDSILAQSLAVDELHVFDWNSTDGTQGIVEDWLLRRATSPLAAQLHLRQEAPGPARSFLHALAQVTESSRAELVFLSDQDDIWSHGKVSAFVQQYCAETDGFDLAFSDARVVSDAGSTAFPSFYGPGSPYLRPRNSLDQSMLVTNPAIGMTMCLRRAWLAKVGSAFDNFWIMHDWALMALAWLTHAQVQFLDAPLVDYRQHGSNALGASINRSILSRAGRIREHVVNVRRQIDSMRAAAESLGVEGTAAAELAAASSGRWRPARVAAQSKMLRPHYRALLCGALLIF
jgi:glycosyltransferase involved in cell wall biosynthesis